MSPRAAMRPHILSLALVLAVCISLFEKSESNSEAHRILAASGGSVKTLSLDEYGLPKKVAEKPKEVNPYAEATSAKASSSLEKPVEKSDKYEEPSAPKKVKKEKSDDLDASTAYVKTEKKEKSDDSDKKEKKKIVDSDVSASPKKEKKEKSGDSDESSSSSKKKKKPDGSDGYVSPKKEKKEKSDDDSDESSSSSKKKKKDKSAGSSDGYVSPDKKEKKEKKSDDSDNEDASSAKKETKKKQKAIEADASSYFKKEKKAEKGKKKEKSSNKEESDDDAAPVDVSTTTGEYVSPTEAKKEEDDASPAAVTAAPKVISPAAKGYADEFATQKSQAASDQPIMGGSPDELPPSSKKPSNDPYANVPSDSNPNKPKLSTETFGGMINRPTMPLPLPVPHQPATPVSPETKRVCADTGYPADCEASIAELPGGAGGQPASDPVAVLRLAMEAVREKAVEALNAATDRMNAPGVEPVVKEALDTCTTSYSDITSNLEVVDAALKRGDLPTARTNLDSVETDVTTCDDGFSERGATSVMTDHDMELQRLASDLIAIAANSIHHA